MTFDLRLFSAVNGLAGRVDFFDRLFSGLANDYFVVIAMCLALVWMWFGTRTQGVRERNQWAVLKSMAGLGIASGFVSLSNIFFVGADKFTGTRLHEIFNRPRPFATSGLDVKMLFYQPTDPSFPSNMAAVVFGLAIAVWLTNRRAGKWFIAMALVACFARVYVGIHFPSDILGGLGFAVAGVAVAYFLFWVFRPLKNILQMVLKSLHLMG